MEKNIEQILSNSINKELDKPLATLLVAEESDKLFFIGEAILTAVGLYILKKYLDVLLGEEVEKVAQNHKQKLKDFWEKVKNNKISTPDLNEYKNKLQLSFDNFQPERTSLDKIEDAENKITDMLIHNGAVRKQAEKLAKSITQAIFNDKY